MCFGVAFSAFPAEAVQLHVYTFKTSLPLPDVTKPSGLVEGGILPLSAVGLPPGACSVSGYRPGPGVAVGLSDSPSGACSASVLCLLLGAPTSTGLEMAMGAECWTCGVAVLQQLRFG